MSFYSGVAGADLGFCCLIRPDGDLRSWLRWLRCVETERDRLAEQLEYAALFRGRDGEFLEAFPGEADGVSGEGAQVGDELLGQVRDLEAEWTQDAIQRITTENTTLKPSLRYVLSRSYWC